MAPQPELSALDLEDAVQGLMMRLAKDPVLKNAKVAAITRTSSLGLWAYVYSDSSEFAVMCVMRAADDQWGEALRLFGLQDEDRTGRLHQA